MIKTNINNIILGVGMGSLMAYAVVFIVTFLMAYYSGVDQVNININLMKEKKIEMGMIILSIPFIFYTFFKVIRAMGGGRLYD